MSIKIKILACICLIVLIFSYFWPAVSLSMYTAYTNKSCYVYKKSTVSSTKIKLSINTKVYVVGTAGSFYKVYNSKKTTKGYILKSNISKTKTSTTTPITWKDKVEKLDWAMGKNVLRRSGYAYIYDIRKGNRIKVKRLGGTNHMDLEPASSSDTSKLKKVCGGTYSWKTYPVILQVNGRYIAASINTKPHGSQSIKSNGFKGHFCLHLVNSTTHGTNLVNEEHQKTIDEAYKWAWGDSGNVLESEL